MIPGRRIGPYEVISFLGAGGMGEVYLVQDSRLGRRAALKLLRAQFSQEEGRLRRFEQEARAASALNHPNILTIYEIGVADEVPYIATEFIDGETLRALLSRGMMRLRDTLDIAIQTADALAAAHEAGIVHRDIKPENIMVRRDGYVKVLDFGLVKLTEPQRPFSESVASAESIGTTEPGLILGTVSYMSPEQLRGQQVDFRTDVFSLGVVLYEMVAGVVPFAGGTGADRVASILYREPSPLRASRSEAPEELEWCVSRALAKEREERYQHVKDFLIDLKGIRQRQEFEFEMRRAGASVSKPQASAQIDTAPVPGAPARPETSSAARRPGMGAGTLWVAGLLIAAAAILFLLRSNLGWRASEPHPFEKVTIQKLTSTGKATVAAISPDGKYVSYALEEGAGRSLWMLQLATLTNLQIVRADDVEYWGITFTPDGEYVCYVTWQWNAAEAQLRRVPVLGGSPKTILSRVGSPISFSPDGKRFAFTDGSSARGESWLIVAGADGSESRALATLRAPSYFCGYLLGPAWSQDGRFVSAVAGNSEKDALGRYVSVLDAEAGKESNSPARRWYDLSGLGWLRNGRGMVVAANEEISSPMQLWFVSHPDGPSRRITTDADDYRGISLTGDSSTIATVQTFRTSNIWVVPGTDASRARQVTSEVSAGSGMEGVSWTPDGRIVHRFNSGRSQDLWIMKADGSDRRQLTEGARNNIHPVVSPDGKYVVFVSDRGGNLSIWRMDLDGSNSRRLTDGDNDVFPTCSPDGRWVVFQRGYGYDTRQTLYRVKIDGGEAIEITKQISRGPVVSPDGRQIACFQLDQGGWSLAVVRLDSGVTEWRSRLPATVTTRVVRWTPDGKALAYVENREGTANIWVLPLEEGHARQLTDFRADLIFDFDWSRDGTQIACSRGSLSSDVVLIRHLRD